MIYHTGNEQINKEDLFERAQIHEGMHVADFGCGRTAHIVIPASKLVGESGVVYAIDILKQSLESIQRHAQINGVMNLSCVWSDIERFGATAIPEHSLDVAFLINVLHQTENIDAFLKEVLRLTRKKARIIIVDWTTGEYHFGPGKDDVLDFTAIQIWAAKHGLVVQEEFESGKHHKGIILYRHD